ncbi:SseB family protein [Sedimentitalea todarodis]|uniref:SseB family protein n=1 Tax=Sedimentitalea todarodis TaxID=1631240 RepID=A0ABU3VFT0_9RHOB|nr:SseB family protein [Sedimentitalea todarodis]MDU9005048.1 SseB family protein [Sedimentitalea todarodis]
MTETTPLDTAHAAMFAAPDDDAARLRFYERLGDNELFLLLTEEAQGDSLSPEVFELADGQFVLAFDRETRLAQFIGRPAPYAALSGRVLSRMLAGQGIGMGLNLDVAPSSILIPADALAWLSETLTHAPDEITSRISEISVPVGLPEAVISALDTKLATASGYAQAAYLVGVEYENGSHGHLLGFVEARPEAQAALAKAAGEALTFSGVEAGSIDVAFFEAADRITAKLDRFGLRFDLPGPPEPDVAGHAAPGTDPDKPPILR